MPDPGAYKPRSQAQRRDHPSPIGLWVRQTDERRLDVTLTLWGHRAGAARTLALGALDGAERAGLWDGASAVPFDVEARVIFGPRAA